MPAAALVAALTFAFTAPSPTPSTAAMRCVDGGANEARASGEDEEVVFSPAFIGRAMSIEASADGLSDATLPLSIELVCGVPQRLRKDAEQLAGGDGVAIITTRTSVWKDGTQLTPSRKLVELDGADTVRLRVRLLPQPTWLADEDGNQLPTFRTSRVVITD